MSYSRFDGLSEPLVDVEKLAPDHPAMITDRTKWLWKVRIPRADDTVLKTGEYTRKLGDLIDKGRWKSFPIYYLALEERRTCPTSCAVRDICYGNATPRADRWIVGPELFGHLEVELDNLSMEYARGFAVRLHELGDFPDFEYARWWVDALDRFPAMHIFGFTAHHRSSPIGSYLDEVSRSQWERFALRFSGETGERSAFNIDYLARGRISQGVICPGQTEKITVVVDGKPVQRHRKCGECGFCWQSKDPVGFMNH